MGRVEKNGLKIRSILFDFINNEVIPGTTINSDEFWIKFAKIVHELAPLNKSLIQKREDLQKKIDAWHIENRGNQIEIEKYKKFLIEIGYLKKDKIYKKKLMNGILKIKIIKLRLKNIKNF